MPSPVPPPKPTRFEYVFIPADTAYPIEARDYDQVDLEDDTFIRMIKKYFAMANPECGVDREMLIKQMSDHAKRDITESLDAATLDRVMNMTSVDILTIALPTPENGHVGVSLYCDDKGRSKKLPLNERASGLGAACGLTGQTFHGDVFLSRMYDDGEDHWFRLSFTMADVSSNAEWVKRASEQASRRLSSGPASLSGLAEQFMARTGNSQAPTIISETNRSASKSTGETETYRWYQTEDDIEVTFPVDETVGKSAISVDIKQKTLKVKIGETVVVDGQLFEPVDSSDCTWTFSAKDRIVQLTLVKKTGGKMWDDLLKQ